jgi:hypothetical protein
MQCPPRAVVVTRPIESNASRRSLGPSSTPSSHSRELRRGSANPNSTIYNSNSARNSNTCSTREYVAAVASIPVVIKQRTSAPVDIPHRRRSSSPPIGTVTLAKPIQSRENNHESKSHKVRPRRHTRSQSMPSLDSSRSLLEPDSLPLLSRNRRESMPTSSRALVSTSLSGATFSSSASSSSLRHLSSKGVQRSEAKHLRPPAVFSFDIEHSPDSSPLLSSSTSSANSSPLLSPSRSLSLSGSLFASQLWSDPASMMLLGPTRNSNSMRVSSSPIGPGSSSQAMSRSVSASQWSPWGQPTPTSVSAWSPWAESHAMFPLSEAKQLF